MDRQTVLAYNTLRLGANAPLEKIDAAWAGAYGSPGSSCVLPFEVIGMIAHGRRLLREGILPRIDFQRASRCDQTSGNANRTAPHANAAESA
jgi:hypothetical protein